MYLKRLEISGFKSFARPTALQYPSRVTAIVGPNGSGKSNCAEAMRWVLGEQSMKTLRSKKGEDLIFAGSATEPRMSKAQVVLVFDNSRKHFDVEFDEAAIGRRVFRDGENEYLLNGSPTRLKDTAELLAGVGIGSSQHNIISQGESDRILYVSSAERKEMIEEALGLKVYHLKYEEAERKLEKSEENIKQAEGLRKEIQPHVKFLKNQVEKFERATSIRRELEEKFCAYFEKEAAYLRNEEMTTKERKINPQEKLRAVERKQSELKAALNKESSKKNKLSLDELENARKELVILRDKRSRLEREMGKIEGIIEAEKLRGISDEEEVVSREDVEQFLGGLEESLSAILEESTVDEIYSIVHESIGRISSFLTGLESSSPEDRDAGRLSELNRQRERAADALGALYNEEQKLFRIEKQLGADAHESERNLREMEKQIYELEIEASKIKDELRSVEIAEERLRMHKDEFLREKSENLRFLEAISIKDGSAAFADGERDRLRKEIDRLKFRLEESGGVDAGILKEYKDIEERDGFFVREIADLEKTAGDLRKLSAELLEKLDEEFADGIQKINKEFSAFFSAMFSGGRAELEILRPSKTRIRPKKDDAGTGDEFDIYHHDIQNEEGIDIKVSLPKKKIKSLEMLSGGERALISIALLFALSSVNPPPFMVLDEIDAALDEANSRRYGEMLKNLAKETQLIIITHNRESMRQAGVLYGVTMGNDGISKILSLKLEEAAGYTNR